MYSMLTVHDFPYYRSESLDIITLCSNEELIALICRYLSGTSSWTKHRLGQAYFQTFAGALGNSQDESV